MEKIDLSKYAFDTLEHACASYRTLLADKDLGVINKQDFETVLAMMRKRWGRAIQGRQHSLSADTGKYSRPF